MSIPVADGMQETSAIKTFPDLRGPDNDDEGATDKGEAESLGR
jgi:hypothetical protein